jgi:hypothetical protein
MGAAVVVAACAAGSDESGRAPASTAADTRASTAVDTAAGTSASTAADTSAGTAAGTSAGTAPPVTDPSRGTTSSVPSVPAGSTPTVEGRDGGSQQPVSFAFAGDTQFPDVQDTDPGVISTGLPLLADQLRADPTHVLAPVAPILSSADLSMVNLETAITDRGTPVPKTYHFRSPAASFTALRSAGVDVVNMANNHALDYGPVGLQDTLDAISSSHFPVVGIGHDAAEAYRPYRTVIKGQRIAIFGALDRVEPALIPGWGATDTRPGLALATERERLLGAIRTVRPEVDTLIVFLHWGTEQTSCASPEQVDLADAVRGAGADMVIGSHAHRVFGAGRIGPTFVAFGLGNFVYFREDGESGRTGILLVQATGRRVDSYSWVPARITHGIPIPETGKAAASSIADWGQRRICSGLSL